MKKKAELLRAINAQRKNVLNLLQGGKLDEAKLASDELDKMSKEYDSMPDEKPVNQGGNVMDKKLLKKAVNQYLHKGWSGMDDESKSMLKPVNATDGTGQVEAVGNRGGVFVPVETADFVGMMETGIYRLRTLVSDYFVRTLSGKIPLANNPTAGLVEFFDELPASGIARKDIKFGSVEWAVKDYGVIVPVSNDLLADAEADVMGVIGEVFARAQVNTENAMILSAIDANGAATEVSDWKGILKELNATAPVGGEKKIITNTDGYNYLDTLTDNQGRPLLTQALVDNPKRIFRGYEVVQLPNDTLATGKNGEIPFYVGSLKDAVYFIERKGMEISYNPFSDSAYSKNAVDVRVTCRLDAKTKFATAVKKLSLVLA